METVKAINYKGYSIRIIQDENFDSPDNWGNTDLFLVYDHRDFCIQRKGFNPEEINEYLNILNALNASFIEVDYLNELNERKSELSKYDNYHIFPVYAYIHSGIALSLGKNQYPFDCRWDTSMRGYILYEKNSVDIPLNKEHNKELENKTDEEIYYHFANGLIETWNDYLSGNVYGYEIIDNDEDEDNLHSCWGFYGDFEKSGLIDEAKSQIDCELTRKSKIIDYVI
jgi:hypothetical protein